MALPAPIFWKSKIIMIKLETVEGTDAAPTGTLNAFLMKDVQFQPMEGQDASRNLERPFMGAQEEYPTGVYSVLQGTIELVGSGDTGVAPGWGPALRICGIAEVVDPDAVPGDGSGTVEYTPISDGFESASVHFYIGTTRHVMLGSKATGQITMNAQGFPEIRVTISGLFTKPTNQARPAIDLSSFVEPQIVTKAQTPVFQIDDIDFAMVNFGFDLACAVAPRMNVGREQILITDKNERITLTVEAQPLASFNPFDVSIDRTRVPLVIEHGTVAGKRVKIEAPVCSIGRITGYGNSQDVTEWPLTLTPLPVAGDDQWKITLS